MTIHRLRGPVDSAHDLRATGVFEVGEAGRFLEVIWKEQIEQPAAFGLLAQLLHQWRRLPAILRQLGLHDGVSGDAFFFNKFVDSFDFLYGVRSNLFENPCWVAAEGRRARVDFDLCHLGG